MHKLACLGMRRLTETQRVHCRNGARAHGEHVAQDAAHARGCALIGLDIGRVIVAFHFENNALAVADIDDARVFARATDDLWAFGWQGPQPFLGGFVGTMLVPHGRENPKLGKARLASDDFKDTFIFVGLQAMCRDQLVGDCRILHVDGFPQILLWRLFRVSRAGGEGAEARLLDRILLIGLCDAKPRGRHGHFGKPMARRGTSRGPPQRGARTQCSV